MEYELIRCARRSISLRIKSDGALIVRVPLLMSESAVSCFVQKHEGWILRKREELKLSPALCEISPEETQTLRLEALQKLPPMVARFAAQMGVKPLSVRVNSARHRYGSCGAGGSLNFSWRIMLMPVELQELIVAHELSHIRQRNHSPAFYAELARYMPDYRLRMKKLKLYEKGEARR